MSLTKEQINKIRRDATILPDVEYTESELREAVGITNKLRGVKDQVICWSHVAQYVFCYFNMFSKDFKREVKEHFIEETANKYNLNKQEATIVAKECICNFLVAHMIKNFTSGRDIDAIVVLQEIKRGYFNEYIDYDDIIPFS